MDKFEDQEIQKNREPNEGLQLCVTIHLFFYAQNCPFKSINSNFWLTISQNYEYPYVCRNVSDSVWLTKEQLQDKIIEEITDKQYEEFVAIMDRLLAHPYSYKCKDFIMDYRHVLRSQQEDRTIIEPKVGENGRQYVTTYGI